jgi:hypothetical protein
MIMAAVTSALILAASNASCLGSVTKIVVHVVL